MQTLELAAKVIFANKKVALVCFVKTPGLGPVKTRLASKVGGVHAVNFYAQSIKATKQIMGKAEKLYSKKGFDPIWAVAEEKSNITENFWSSFKIIYQGSGGLGDRLCHVYKQLISKYKKVIFIGADSPHLNPETILDSVELLEANDFVLGPSEDGGYYLFAGKKDLNREVWLNTPYSVENTFEVFKGHLENHGSLKTLPSNFDIDDLENIKALVNLKGDNLLSEQIKTQEFAKQMI